MRRAAAHIGIFASALLTTLPAGGETLVAAVSPSIVRVEPDFDGAELTVFGTVERDPLAADAAGPYELAVLVRGPEHTIITRRKERVFGLWMNQGNRSFVNVPSFYSLLTTAPLDQVATPAVLQAKGLGVKNLTIADSSGVRAPPQVDPFRAAFVDQMKREHRYSEQEGAVTFMSQTLFRTTVTLPPNAPVGTYRIAVHVFRGGAALGDTETFLQVRKAGLEQWIYGLALRRPWFYGVATVLTGLMAGWLAAAIFRRD